MTTVYVSVGSNIEKHKHIEMAIRELSQLGQDAIRLSTLYECPPLGFTGDSFFNLVVEIRTSSSLDTVVRQLRDIELRWGRHVDAQKYQDRTLDLDIILFGDRVKAAHPQLPRKDIYQYSFVIQPLYELCPDLVIPNDGRLIREIWTLADNLNVLKPVPLWF